MSVKAIKWAYAQRVGSPTGKAVLIALADNANDEGYCWPSFTTIADKTELTRTAVRNWITKLEGDKFVEKEHRHADSGDHTSNKYRLRFERTEVGNEVAHVGNDVAHLGNEVAHGVGNEVAHPGNEIAQVGNEVAHPPEVKTSASRASRGLQTDPSISNRHLTVIEPPLPQPQASASAETENVCGGRGVFQKEEQEKERPLAFPEKLNAREKTEALKLLGQIDDQPAQEILDVLAAAIQAGEVRKSPLAVLRGLVSRFKDGTFDPTPGLHLATARERQRYFEAQTQQQVKAAQVELLKAQPAPPSSLSGIDQLRAARRGLKGGYRA